VRLPELGHCNAFMAEPAIARACQLLAEQDQASSSEDERVAAVL
jgi:hypothetical protein